MTRQRLGARDSECVKLIRRGDFALLGVASQLAGRAALLPAPEGYRSAGYHGCYLISSLSGFLLLLPSEAGGLIMPEFRSSGLPGKEMKATKDSGILGEGDNDKRLVQVVTSSVPAPHSLESRVLNTKTCCSDQMQ